MPEEVEQSEAAIPLPQDIRDVQTIKHETCFLLSDRYGDVVAGSSAALGLYFRDTRFLSCWELRVNGIRPVYLHAEADRNYSMRIETTMPVELPALDGRRRTENLQVSRHRWLEG
ncbi:MAG TPA: glycogen debranching N-terminal domain-containing protein, partial [Actinomycetota bacterium]|nr:glycogen debranching N-terminal domain-containing protein [Actinomycetota bacterium]